MRPIIINVLRSARILRDASETFRCYGIEGMALDTRRIRAYVNESLMVVMALSPVVAYDRAAAIAHHTSDQWNQFARRCDHEWRHQPREVRQDMSPSPDGWDAAPEPWTALIKRA